MSLGSVLKALWPFVTKTASQIDSDAKAAVAKIETETANKVKSINAQAVIDKINAKASADVSAAEAAWKQHVDLIKADAASQVKAAQAAPSVLTQLGLTGPTGATGTA